MFQKSTTFFIISHCVLLFTSEMQRTRLVLLAVCYTTFSGGTASSATESTCDSSLGFNPKTLSCSVCDDMKEFNLSKQLQNACTVRDQQKVKMLNY